ncbi:MAG TPA: nucleoside recognition domain-containing protein [Syntrophomonadaceae bacterium]|nr:nucleoside recognition domain-containing protein [Syntrophomonadaceae bacterium]
MKYFSNLLFLIIILVFAAFMIINPSETVKAAADGVKLWATAVFPALFPFFVVAELMVSLRFVYFLGILLEPVMRPLFRLPGCSSLVMVMGFTSGFPVGAVLTRKLYDDKMLTADEAQRVACFTNNSSPLFIIGTIGVGMFNLPWIGYLLAAAHYISNLVIGFLLRFLAHKDSIAETAVPGNRLYLAWRELTDYKSSPPGPGQILGDAIKTALVNIMAVGGFIIIFAVLARMLSVWGIIDLLARGLTNLLSMFDLAYPIAYGIGVGLFEVTNGSRVIAAVPGDILHKMVSISALLAFSGLSIIAQIMSILAQTPVRLSFYLRVRLVQILLSVGLIMAGYHACAGHPAITSLSLPVYKIAYSFDAWTFSIYCMAAGIIMILILILVSLSIPRP